MTAPSVRPATVDDAEGIARAHIRSWQGAYRGLMPDHLLDSLDVTTRAQHQREMFERLPAGSAIFVATGDDGRIVGFAQAGEYEAGEHEAGEHEDSADGAGQVYAIYVDPQHWRTGAGRALMAAALAHLTAAGPRPVRLWALDGNERARRFYERCGFVADGARGTHTVRGEFEVPTVRFTLDPG